jgi:23S rRNA (adenine2503-C2)-methyltransferase
MYRLGHSHRAVFKLGCSFFFSSHQPSLKWMKSLATPVALFGCPPSEISWATGANGGIPFQVNSVYNDNVSRLPASLIELVVNLPIVETTGEQRVLPGLLSLSEDELRTWLAEHGEKPMRAKQLRHWLLHRGAESFDEMTDLPKSLRATLAEHFVPLASRIAKHQVASDHTHKLLVEFADHKLIECVLIQDEGRRTACISTQVGCGMGCVFCASGLDGVDRNLTVGEIVEQLVRLRNLPGVVPLAGRASDGAAGQASSRPPNELPERLTHIVVMGMGEPLANLDNLLDALDIATSKDGLGIGARHITISTVGLPVKIRRLADLGKQYHLAVSLHAPNDEVRTTIVPTNDKTGLHEILDAARYFFEKTGRQVTYEYVLLRELNDEARHARELGALLKGRRAHVNLIPFNDVEGLPYRRPTTEALNMFTNVLQSSGISVKVRKRKGSQIDAACGQLRRSATHPPLSSPGEMGRG